jgi:predicted Zn-dependent protease
MGTLTALMLYTALTGFGLDDVVDILESDELESAVNVLEAFGEAGRELTDTEEYYLGRAVAANVLSMYTPLQSQAVQDYVNVAGASIACFSPRPSIFGGYHFMVLQSGDINAMSTPGGHIFICKGLLDLASSEDEMACILAHEIAHVSLRHGVNSVSSAKWTSAFTTLGTEAVNQLGTDEMREATENYGDLVEDITTNLVTKGYSRDSERQADSLAVYMVARAGYDPDAMVSVLRKMSQLSDRSGPGFWQTHPSPEDRIEDVEEVLSHASFPAVSPELVALRTERFRSAMAGIEVVTTSTGESGTVQSGTGGARGGTSSGGTGGATSTGTSGRGGTSGTGTAPPPDGGGERR